jgi:hypothetical protein
MHAHSDFSASLVPLGRLGDQAYPNLMLLHDTWLTAELPQAGAEGICWLADNGQRHLVT